MKKSISKTIVVFMTVFMMIISISLILGCGDNENPHTTPPPAKGMSDADYLMIDGDKIKKNYAFGEEVTLRGINVGGYLVLESWMSPMNATDHKSMTETLVERFGEKQTEELWEYYRSQFWTDEDFQNCADMGMNVIRLPFTYMSVDPEYNNVASIAGQKYNFTVLDDFIEKAASYGIYTILDMHGAYGSQNGQDHSGQTISNVSNVDFYSNATNKNRTVDLWTAIAQRYADNPAVAGYDLLNEPGEKGGSTTSVHWDFFNELYNAIRSVDENHIIIFESCWEGRNLPKLSRYGWTNCIYSFHHYTSYDSYTHIDSFNRRITEVNSQNFGIPIYMGEFTCYSDEDDWVDTLTMLNENNWSWTPWTYKRNRTGSSSGVSSDGWGIFHTRAARVDPSVDTVEQIKEKWLNVRTDSANTSKQTFSSGNTLYNVLTDANYYTAIVI